MNTRANHIYRKFFGLFFVVAIVGILSFGAQAAKLSPTLQQQLTSVSNNSSVGIVIVSFKTSNGLQNSHLNVLRGVGLTGGQTFPTLGMVATTMTAGQVRALQSNTAIRSIWSNDQLQYFMNQARMMTGVDKLRSDSASTLRNGGMPVSGAGDFSVLVIDSGIDATRNMRKDV